MLLTKPVVYVTRELPERGFENQTAHETHLKKKTCPEEATG
jgi:hypothetical protein